MTYTQYSKTLAPRDEMMVYLMFRHGLRVSELIALTWKQFDLDNFVFYPKRSKGGKNTPHPLDKESLKMLKRYKAFHDKHSTHQGSTYLFVSRKGGQLSKRTVHEKIQILGREAGLGSHVHPHMLRHSCGYHLIAQGLDIRRVQAFLGHKDIKNTQIYTEVTSNQLEDIEW